MGCGLPYTPFALLTSAASTPDKPGAHTGANRLFLTRGLRGFADGAVSVLLVPHLASLGFSELQIGALVTGTLLGSALLTLATGFWGGPLRQRSILLAASLLMFATGLGFLALHSFVPLFALAVIGTLNPSAGDVSVFLPAEQALLSQVAADRRITAFARYNVCGNLAGALGALATGLPDKLARLFGAATQDAARWGFLAYALIALVVAFLYRGLPREPALGRASRAPLAKSRSVVLRLAALFSLDSLGGGLVVQSLLALWLFKRFGLSVSQVGSVFFACGVLSAFSQLLSGPLARRIGLIRTMVYTHVPANALLILAAFMPTAGLAVTMLLLRMSLAQMDVPARQAYVMGVVPPEERAAAASVTNVPRSLAAAVSPVLAGLLLSHTSFGWPLVIGGGLKILYDLLLLQQFRAHPVNAE
jgi:MFS family permease